MAKIICITNQKGGVGKSTTALALGACLHQIYNAKVLYIDLDPQCNITHTLCSSGELSALELLKGEATAAECIEHTAQGDFIKAVPNLSGLEMIMQDYGREYVLKEKISSISGYDYIIIDTPPSLSLLTVSALTAADTVIIPAQADIYSLQGIGHLLQTIETIKKYSNKQLTIAGLLLTRYSGRTNITKEITRLLGEMAAQYNIRLFNAKIRECTAIREAQALKESIFKCSPRSNAVQDYTAFTEEFINL